MKSQHTLQLQILQRYRSLGMSAQLPAFQGNVPIQLKALHADSNITKQGDTGWMDSLDPLYAQIADVWMKTLLADFGTDHWYQLDGYFNGGTAPWLATADPAAGEQPLSPPAASMHQSSEWAIESQNADLDEGSDGSSPACTWSGEEHGFVATAACHPCKVWSSVEDAKSRCVGTNRCGGITSTNDGAGWLLREGTTVLNSTVGEVSYVITNDAACHPPKPIVSDPL